MLKRNLNSFMILIVTFILLVGTVFAWSTISRVTDINIIELNVNSSIIDTFLFVQKNDGEENPITNPEELTNILNLGIPNDAYQFRVRMRNNTDKEMLVNVKFKNMQNFGTVTDADIRDVYLLVDSKITFAEEDYQVTPVGPTTPGVGYEGQELKYNRFKNYLNADNDMILLVNGKLEPHKTVDLVFLVRFDWDISNTAYTGSILIEKLVVDIE